MKSFLSNDEALFDFKVIDKSVKNYNLDMEELVNLAGFGNRSML